MLFHLKPKLSVTIIATSLLVFYGCKGGNKNAAGADSKKGIDTAMTEQNILKDITTTKQIFYSLPSPLESANLIKSAGATYNESLLNLTKNVTKYTTNKAMALNLGIYITDLSYASLFDQPQATMKYIEVAKKMADGLGITDAIDKQTINRLEENINNRDVIMDIISETFMSSTAFLTENERQPLATISLIGGWVEGLYLATQLVDENNFENNKIVSRIVDQKLSLDMVFKLIENNKNNTDIKDVTPLMEELKAAYDKVTIESTKIDPVVDKKTNVTTLKSTTKSNINKEIFKDLKETVKKIRNNFTL